MEKLFNENNCLVNLSSSILRHYDVDPYHPSLSSLDKVLDKTDKRICLILLDGLGSYIRTVYSNYCSDLNSHFLTQITSVFPPTTVAATTALITDRYPSETGWLGWTEQFPQYDRAVTMFPSTFEQEPKEPTPESTYSLLPYETIFPMLEEKGIKTGQVKSFQLNDLLPSTFLKATEESLNDNDFIYAYTGEPDSSLHKYGVGSKEVASVIKEFNDGIVSLAEKHKDTLFIVIADHGHLNIKDYKIDEYDDFYSLLRIKHFACEPRAAFFYVKEGKEKEFKASALKHYGEHFYVLSKQEVIKNHIFGYGEPCDSFESLLGDFVLISKDEASFLQAYDVPHMMSTHAGSTDEEKYIDVSIFNA